MRYRVIHTTEYHYSESVGRCYNLANVIPRETPRQTCLSNQLKVQPIPAHANKREDYFGNAAYYFAIQKQHCDMAITAESEVEVSEHNDEPTLEFGLSCAAVKEKLWTQADGETFMAREYLLDSPMIKATDTLKAYAAPLFTSDRPLLSAVRALTQKIYEDFAYEPGVTNVATPLAEVLKHKRGVCQDFAHVAIGCLRALGFPARYVSGYLETLPPPGQEKLVGADATHAWLSVYSPGEGWFEFDPTNDKMAGEQHIVTAWGRDYSDVTPLRGVLFGGGETHQLKVGVTVQRVV